MTSVQLSLGMPTGGAFKLRLASLVRHMLPRRHNQLTSKLVIQYESPGPIRSTHPFRSRIPLTACAKYLESPHVGRMLLP